MTDVEHFALITLLTAAALVAAVLSNRISERTRIPAPALFLVQLRVSCWHISWRYRRNLWMSPWHENAAYLPP